MLPEEKARVKIDKQLRNAGWDIVARNEYLPNSTSAVKEALMGGNTESDYLLFIDGKAIAVVEAKREENPLGDEVKKQAEDYAISPQVWYGLWFEKLIPLVYMANGNKIYFKNMLVEGSDYEELSQMHSPKKMLQIVGKKSEYGALPLIEKRGLRDCQYRAEVKFEESLKMGNKKNLAVLATGSGKTYLACLASYRLLNYTPTRRILFLVDRNNLARQTESEFSVFDRTEGQQKMGNLYTINRLKKEEDIKGDIVISTIQKLFCVLTGQAINDSDEDAEDEKAKADEEKNSKTVIELGNDLKLPPDYFQLIIVDECHRSIYGKWKKVLDYFSDATVLGLTATPTPEAYAFFNKNVIEEYTYEALKNAVAKIINIEGKSMTELLEEKVAQGEPLVVMLVGINGTGKTTTIGKLSNYYIKKGYTPVIAASDTFRAGAIEQVQYHADNLGVKLIKHEKGSDPAAVAFDAVQHARAKGKELVLIDTAGRMQTNTNLMDEMKKIRRVSKPDLVVFVGDALTGNDATEQARKFNEAIDIDGVILTKADADSKGGAALSIGYIIQKPILFLGMGQSYDDIKEYDADWMLEQIFS